MSTYKELPLNQASCLIGEAVAGAADLTVLPRTEPPEGALYAAAYDVIELKWSGERGHIGGVQWLETDYIVVDLMAEMDSMARVRLSFIDSRREDSRLTAGYSVVPNRRVKMAVRLDELDSHRFFLPTLPGNYKGMVNGEPTHISRIDTVRLSLARGQRVRALHIYGIALTGELPDMTVRGDPMADAYGQRRDAEWPGKIHGDEELSAYLRGELDKARAGGGYPQGWSRYGGWLGKRFEATGFFHARHDGRRWWLADPDGYAFFSNGCCYGSRMGDFGFTDRMENLYEWLPDDPAYREAWTTADQIAEFVKRNGEEAGRGRRLFNFARANMIRVFGAGWWDAWAEINGARLRGWGFNTIGVGVNNYEDERVLEYLEKVKIPFVWTLKRFPLTAQCIFRDFPDVLSPEYEERSRAFAEQLRPLADNPCLIGYFVTNEPEWLFQRSVNPAERVLAHPVRLHSKTALVAFLRERYGGDIAAFNAAWGTGLADFDGLYAPLANADTLTARSNADLMDFRAILMDRYCRVPNEALRRVDGNHMNLGMRYAHVGSGDAAGAQWSEVMSFNCYRPTPRPMLDLAGFEAGKPLIIGEWHVGGTDNRLLASALQATASQADRAEACAFYMEQCMSHPNCVGAHYFEFNDQPLLGRFDGECMQHGLIDVCNRPYDLLTRRMRAVAERMYALCDGGIEPIGAGAPFVYPF